MARARLGGLTRLPDRVVEWGYRHEFAHRITGSVVLPLAAVGAVVGMMLRQAYGPWGITGTVLHYALLLVLAAAWLSQVFFALSGAVWLVSCFALIVALVAGQMAVKDWVMHSRGKETRCVVLDVDKRVETYTTTDAEGHTTTTTETYYDHRLRCTGGHPDAMTTDSPTVDRGERINVAYDPLGRLSPRPADDITDGRIYLWVCGGALALAILLRLGEVVVKKPRRGGGWY